MTPYLETVADELATQAAFLAEREAVYAHALALLQEQLAGSFGTLLEKTWDGRAFHASYERPLLLLAALRNDALLEGPGHPLHAALCASPPDADAVTAAALAQAVAPERTRFYAVLRNRAVQTNETTRAVTWLWPAHLLWRSGERRTLTLVDLGASAGLNLVADGLPASWVDGAGTSVPVAPLPPIAMRLGVDVSPIDVASETDATWLRACVWPSDSARRARLEQAITEYAARAAEPGGPKLTACGLADVWPVLEVLPRDGVVLCVQTIVRDYLAADDRARYETAKRNFLIARPPRSVFIAELELDAAAGAPAERSAAVTLRFREDGEPKALVLARTHPHPRTLYVEAAAVAELGRQSSAGNAKQ